MKEDQVQEKKQSYSRVEFQLENPKAFFQFRVRQHPGMPPFVLIQKEIGDLPGLRPGLRLAMTFYSEEKGGLPQTRTVEIKSVEDGGAVGFPGCLIMTLSV